MGLLRNVLITIVVIVVLYYIFNWLFRKSTQLTTLQNANLMQTIQADTLANNNNTSNFAYSTWFYVDDWNYRFGEEKVLLHRAESSGTQNADTGFGISLGAMQNNLLINVDCYPQNQTTGVLGSESVRHTCNVDNFPLQKWVNLIVSVYGRTLDVYIDGKLVRTCVLPGVAKVDPSHNIIVTPSGGFHGYTGNFQYWQYALNPQQAYNIYKGGFGGSWLGNLFNKYRVKISFLEDNQEKGSFEF